MNKRNLLFVYKTDLLVAPLTSRPWLLGCVELVRRRRRTSQLHCGRARTPHRAASVEPADEGPGTHAGRDPVAAHLQTLTTAYDTVPAVVATATEVLPQLIDTGKANEQVTRQSMAQRPEHVMPECFRFR
jgi:hypothetical protein